jgi:hypothetical protein
MSFPECKESQLKLVFGDNFFSTTQFFANYNLYSKFKYILQY